MHPPIQLNLFIQESIMKDLMYADFKQILLNWTATIAKASIDGTRSAEDAEFLRFSLVRFIRALSSSDLRTSKVKEVVREFQMLTSKDSGSDERISDMNVGYALSQGASVKEFNEWQSGGLGRALKEQVESILGENWQRK
jgi:hypothetical protein